MLSRFPTAHSFILFHVVASLILSSSSWHSWVTRSMTHTQTHTTKIARIAVVSSSFSAIEMFQSFKNQKRWSYISGTGSFVSYARVLRWCNGSLQWILRCISNYIRKFFPQIVCYLTLQSILILASLLFNYHVIKNVCMDDHHPFWYLFKTSRICQGCSTLQCKKQNALAHRWVCNSFLDFLMSTVVLDCSLASSVNRTNCQIMFLSFFPINLTSWIIWLESGQFQTRVS